MEYTDQDLHDVRWLLAVIVSAAVTMWSDPLYYLTLTAFVSVKAGLRVARIW